MALLTYDFRVINANALSSVLSSNERRIAQHNARVARVTGTPVARAGGAAGAGRQLDAHVKARAAHEAQLAKAATALDRQRSAALMTLYRAEQRERLRGERMVAAEAAKLDRERHSRAVALGRAAGRASARTELGFRARQESERRAISGAVRGRIGRSLTGALSGVGSVAVGALGIGGSIAAGSAIRTEMGERAQASRLAIQAKQPELKGALLNEARQVQGFTGSEALTALEGFVTKTGDLAAARGMLQGMGSLALATSTDLGELGEAAGQAFNVLRDTIEDPAERMKALQEVMASLAAQGTLGAVEIKDMATELGGLGAATRSFKGSPVDLLKTVGAMAQTAVARGGAASAAEATTSVVRFASDLTKKPAQKALKGLGIEAFSDQGKTQLRSPQELMADILDKTKGDLTKVGDIFGEYGVRAVRGFSPLYTEAEKKQKGSGRAAVLAEFERFTGAASSPAEIQRLAASRLTDPDVQSKEAIKQFNAAIGSELLPVIVQLIPEFVALLPNITKAARAFAVIGEEILRNPITGIGQLIAAKVALDLAGAGIGSAARAALEGALNSGLGKALGSAGLVVGTLAASVELANLIVSALKVEGETAAKGATASANKIREKAQAELATTGTLTPETRAELAQLQQTETETLTKGREALAGSGFFDVARRGFNQVFGTGDGEDLSQLSRLGATVSNEQYSRGAEATKGLLMADELGQKSADAGKRFAEEVIAATQVLKETLESARPPLNRTDKPAPPVP